MSVLIFEEDEIWKDVIGYEGIYQVSNYGRVKRKFNPEIISNIRKDYKTGQFTHSQLARKYSTSRPYMTRILNKKNWSDI